MEKKESQESSNSSSDEPSSSSSSSQSSSQSSRSSSPPSSPVQPENNGNSSDEREKPKFRKAPEAKEVPLKKAKQEKISEKKTSEKPPRKREEITQFKEGEVNAYFDFDAKKVFEEFKEGKKDDLYDIVLDKQIKDSIFENNNFDNCFVIITAKGSDKVFICLNEIKMKISEIINCEDLRLLVKNFGTSINYDMKEGKTIPSSEHMSGNILNGDPKNKSDYYSPVILGNFMIGWWKRMEKRISEFFPETKKKEIIDQVKKLEWILFNIQSLFSVYNSSLYKSKRKHKTLLTEEEKKEFEKKIDFHYPKVQGARVPSKPRARRVPKLKDEEARQLFEIEVPQEHMRIFREFVTRTSEYDNFIEKVTEHNSFLTILPFIFDEMDEEKKKKVVGFIRSMVEK
jgi:hypothetical protein